MAFTNNLFYFIIVLGTLIFVHELGHFLFARLFGVGVEKFSLGFGPRLFGRKIGRTEYRVGIIPLGGYVKMVGEEPDQELAPEDIAYSFTHKHVLKRICIVAAGPVFNCLLAVLIFIPFFIFQGQLVADSRPLIGRVMEDSPASRSGLLDGDLITAIEGQPIETWEQMADIIATSQGAARNIAFIRDGMDRTIVVVPEMKTGMNEFGEPVSRYLIGVERMFHHEPVGPIQAISASFSQTWFIVRLTFTVVGKLLKGSMSMDNVGGPIMIAKMAGDQAREGMDRFLFFIALISINLAILNILPIPVLDGGHLMFYVIELIFRRPVSLRIREAANGVGLSLLLLLMAFVIYNDIVQVFIRKSVPLP